MARQPQVGVGVDVEAVSRFEKLDRAEHARFFAMIYSQAELDYCFSRASPAQSLAARFAAKEAVAKAICSAGGPRASLDCLRIGVGAKGQPVVRLQGEGLSGFAAKVSVSHSRGNALAFALVVGTNG